MNSEVVDFLINHREAIKKLIEPLTAQKENLFTISLKEYHKDIKDQYNYTVRACIVHYVATNIQKQVSVEDIVLVVHSFDVDHFLSQEIINV